MIEIIVCGGRDYDEFKAMMWLDGHLTDVDCRIHQGEAAGADRASKKWAKLRGKPCVGYRADWGTHGLRAGILRNEDMRVRSGAQLVVAFPGGKGTADMVRRAEANGIPVYKVRA